MAACGQFRLYTFMQLARACRFEANIFWNETYPQSVNRVLENVWIEKV